MEYLQKIRDHFGKAVSISSAYRCEKHNKKIGGATKSKHMYGQAADIKVSGIKPIEVAKYAESLGCLGIGHYDTFVHIDTRTTKFFWYSDAQIPRTTFGGTPIKEPAQVQKPEVEEEISGDYVEVTGSTVNIRTGPGTEFSSDGTAKKGQKFKIISIPEKWIPIEVNGKVRYISSTYVKKK